MNSRFNIISDNANPSTADVIDAFARAFDHVKTEARRAAWKIPFKVESGPNGPKAIFLQVTRLEYQCAREQNGNPGHLLNSSTWPLFWQTPNRIP